MSRIRATAAHSRLSVRCSQTFGLTRLAELAGWLLIAAAIGGYGLVGQHPYRGGYTSARLTAVIPLLAGAATLIYGLVIAWLGQRSPDPTHALAVTAFLLGSAAFLLLSVLGLA